MKRPRERLPDNADFARELSEMRKRIDEILGEPWPINWPKKRLRCVSNFPNGNRRPTELPSRDRAVETAHAPRNGGVNRQRGKIT